jgi:hypothetical protein
MDPVPRSFGPLPMHLFTDIDEQYRISENDLNITVQIQQGTLPHTS